MVSSEQVLAVASKEVGYSRWTDPLAGTKYGRWYAKKVNVPYFGTSGVPYCAMFVTWVLAQAGLKVAGFPSAYCPDILNACKKAGLVLADKRKAQAGDIVLFDWDGGVVDHIGIVERNYGNYVQTIEGNTSSGNSGSQGNSGLVARRTRSWNVIKAVIRPQYKQTQPQPTLKKAEVKMFTFRVNNEGGIYFYDGEVHPLHHEDEFKALKMAFEKAGYNLPHVELGNAKEPWGTRLLDALTRDNNHKVTVA